MWDLSRRNPQISQPGRAERSLPMRPFAGLCRTVGLCLLLLWLSACTSGSVGTAPVGPTATQSIRQVPSKPDSSALENKTSTALAKVQAIMAHMSLEQKLGQLLIVEYLGRDYQVSGLQEMIVDQYVGGYMYQQSNHNFDAPYDQIANVAALSRQTQAQAKIPLLIATDQEGGLVNRLLKFHGPLPSAASMAATGNTNYVYNQGAQAAKWMLDLGINADLAPVVDVHTVDPPILASRMFGRTPQDVVRYAGAYLQGLQKNHVAACLKHFPGLGAVTSDPHLGLPTVRRDLATLNRIDLAPYKTLIGTNPPAMIMSTDVLMPAIDPTLPAELSPKAINGLLRQQLGFNGVVITDGLYMAGISQRWSLSQASVLAIIAGNDLVEGPYTPSQVASVVTGLKQALQNGKLSIERINQSVQRILLLKVQYGLLK